MPSFVSNGGVWHPAKERVALKNNSTKAIKNPSDKDSKYADEKINPGEDFIYEGADRGALFELFKDKVETFGMDFKKNPEFLQGIRNQGFDSVEKYLEHIGYDEEKLEKEFFKKATVITKHDLPKKAKALNILGGGMDSSGSGEEVYGAFKQAPGI